MKEIENDNTLFKNHVMISFNVMVYDYCKRLRDLVCGKGFMFMVRVRL